MSEEYPFRADKLIAAEQLTKRVDLQRKPYSIKKSENPIKSLILQHGEETGATLGGSRSIEAKVS